MWIFNNSYILFRIRWERIYYHASIFIQIFISEPRSLRISLASSVPPFLSTSRYIKIPPQYALVTLSEYLSIRCIVRDNQVRIKKRPCARMTSTSRKVLRKQRVRALRARRMTTQLGRGSNRFARARPPDIDINESRGAPLERTGSALTYTGT